jgi:hypothetical protein
MSPIQASEMRHRLGRAVLVAALSLAASQGHSHDSWLSPARSTHPPGQLALELATGNRYPLQEFSQTPESVADAHCSDGMATTGLKPMDAKPRWLELAASAAPNGAPLISCWLELAPAEVEIEPPRVQVYFADIQASAGVRENWDAMRSRGLPWRETYRKFARIELAGGSEPNPERIAAARRPAGLDLEIVILGDQPIAVGRPLDFQVLRDGRPLAGLPVELVSERSPLGVWRRTDADGRLHHVLPFAGRWLLRGTDLRLSARQGGIWESRFVTLAIEAR